MAVPVRRRYDSDDDHKYSNMGFDNSRAVERRKTTGKGGSRMDDEMDGMVYMGSTSLIVGTRE